jgi:hypothetical protein
VQAFRDVRLFSDDDGPAPAVVFRTSGTTTSGARPGEHYMSAAGLARYEASLLPVFRAFVLPELSGDQRSDLVPLVLGPPAAEAPHSSLWHMVSVCGRALFTQARVPSCPRAVSIGPASRPCSRRAPPRA